MHDYGTDMKELRAIWRVRITNPETSSLIEWACRGQGGEPLDHTCGDADHKVDRSGGFAIADVIKWNIPMDVSASPNLK
jgi:hypothetical protein